MCCSKDRRFLIFLFLLLSGVPCRAQYHPQYSQYMFNGLAINPAYAGSQDVLNLAALYRTSRWGKSVEGAPVTQTFAGDFPLHNPQLGLGLLIFNDKISVIRQSGAYFAYAYRVKTDKGRLSFGLQAGFDVTRLDESGVNVVHEDDPLFNQSVHIAFMPNIGTGVYYYTSNYFVGLSFPQLLKYFSRSADSYKPKPTLSNTMLYGGLVIPTDNNLKIKPSTLFQYTGNGILFDLNCNVGLLEDKFELGVSWRNRSTLVTMAQFRIQSLSIGYAYDHAIGKPSAINTSHEIMLRYDFRIVVKAVHPLLLK